MTFCSDDETGAGSTPRKRNSESKPSSRLRRGPRRRPRCRGCPTRLKRTLAPSICRSCAVSRVRRSSVGSWRRTRLDRLALPGVQHAVPRLAGRPREDDVECVAPHEMDDPDALQPERRRQRPRDARQLAVHELEADRVHARSLFERPAQVAPEVEGPGQAASALLADVRLPVREILLLPPLRSALAAVHEELGVGDDPRVAGQHVDDPGRAAALGRENDESRHGGAG